MGSCLAARLGETRVYSAGAACCGIEARGGIER